MQTHEKSQFLWSPTMPFDCMRGINAAQILRFYINSISSSIKRPVWEYLSYDLLLADHLQRTLQIKAHNEEMG